MATIQELEDKVTAATEKVEKCAATIQKHEAAVAKKLQALAKFGITAENLEEKKWLGGKVGTGSSEHYWTICEVESKLNDAKSATKKLKEAETILSNWKAKLALDTEKERFLSDNAPEVIKEFLEQWKQKAFEWHVKNYARYVETKNAHYEAVKAAKEAYLAKNPDGRTWGKVYETYIATEHKDVRELSAKLSMFGAVIARMNTYYSESERLAYLEKELEADKKYKMLDLINRVNAVVGSITDAKGLKIDVKGNLNGFIVGTEATAKVETVGAGGYNIQCWHYRTLVHKLK